MSAPGDAVAIDAASLSATDPLRRTFRWFVRTQEGLLTIALLALCILIASRSDVFTSPANIRNLLAQIAITMITATGMTLLIVGREIDLSVGSMQAFVGVVAMQTLNATENFIAGLAVALACGVLIGSINALLTIRLKINSFVVTLAMFSAARGLAYTFTDASVQNSHKLASFKALNQGTVFTLPILGDIRWPIIIMAVIAIVFSLLLTRTSFGRQVYATGGNPKAALLAGVPVDRVRTALFIITSVLAALSAFILIAKMNSGQNNAGFGFELQVIGAVLLGGASLRGGQGTMLGTFLAVLLLGVLNNGIILMGWDSDLIVPINGAVILLAVFLDALRRRLTGEE